MDELLNKFTAHMAKGMKNEEAKSFDFKIRVFTTVFECNEF